MKAHLHSARIAPKKMNIIALLVRGMRVDEALTALSRTHKKGARMVETLINSAVANAEHNDKQRKGNLMIKTIVVNQGTAMRRGTPMARGRMRPMNKFLSHVSVTLGIAEGVHAEAEAKKEKKAAAKKPASSKKTPSQAAKTPVQETNSATTQPVTAKSEVQAEPVVSDVPTQS